MFPTFPWEAPVSAGPCFPPFGRVRGHRDPRVVDVSKTIDNGSGMALPHGFGGARFAVWRTVSDSWRWTDMAFNVRHPIWLPAAPKPGVPVFTVLYFIETFARAIVASVIPIQAYDLFGDEQLVSFAYSGTGMIALAFSFILPYVIRLLSRRWSYTAGCFLLAASGLALASFTVEGQLLGMVARVTGTACLNVTLNLYVLDYIRKEQFVRTDSMRLTFSAFGWTLGPFLGVWLYTHYGVQAPYIVSIVFVAALVIAFWYARMKEKLSPATTRTPPANPLKFIARFVAQPRLRLAWFIAFSRSTFWSTLFIYGPLLIVISGHGNEYGGLLVSIANALLATTFLWGRLSNRIGVRAVLITGFLISAVLSLLAGLSGATWPLMSAGLLLSATIGAIALDAVGGVAYYRAVHAHERTAMTAVYRTYLDFSDLLPPLVYGVLLGFFGLGAVFVAMSVLLASAAYLTWRHLPRRL
jgi:MFS family permease